MTVTFETMDIPRILLSGTLLLPSNATRVVINKDFTSLVENDGVLTIYSNNTPFVFLDSVTVRFTTTLIASRMETYWDVGESWNRVRGMKQSFNKCLGNIIYSFTEKLPSITGCEVYRGSFEIHEATLANRRRDSSLVVRNKVATEDVLPLCVAVNRAGELSRENKLYLRMVSSTVL
jgi:hypothetical protein